MKEKEQFSNPSVRHSGRKEKKIHHEYLLYSAGEDYYSIYQEEKDIDQCIIQKLQESENKEISISSDFTFNQYPSIISINR
ncbi:MAG TPA: hypothetical protein VFC67_21860 [Prolixibacteraceae bacterium]|nr:hypothetical protein [Prolixibacteraceae bacterium]